jgi:hypothetical protein
VRGPRSLRLSGRLADGTILTELSSPGYVRWAREQIDTGRAEAGRTDPHRVLVYALLGAGAAGRDAVRAALADSLRHGGRPQVGPAETKLNSPVTGSVGQRPPRVRRMSSMLALMPRTSSSRSARLIALPRMSSYASSVGAA